MTKPLTSALRTPDRPKRRPPRTTPRKWSDKLDLSGPMMGQLGINNGNSSNADDRSHDSTNSAKTPTSVKTPSSVLLMIHSSTGNSNHNNNSNNNGFNHNNNSNTNTTMLGYPMVRDLSDLSGSYLNGNTAPRGVAPMNAPSDTIITASDQSYTSYHRPWRQAKILSRREPVHPQPHCDDSSTVGLFRNSCLSLLVQPLVVVDDAGIVEIVNNPDDSDHQSRHSHQHQQHHHGEGEEKTEYKPSSQDPEMFSRNSTGTTTTETSTDQGRIPVTLLLMDPGRKMYELMQLWVDVAGDTVRDVLHAIQLNLGDQWRQDYDGIFQVRNNHFSQLIHILNIRKYDLQPHEVWVAKPWSMSAKNTVSYAAGALNHLKYIGVLQYYHVAQHDSSLRAVAATTTATGASSAQHDSYLALSKAAQARIYVPGGVLKHHHACQYLSFSPPFETNNTNTTVRVDVLSGADGLGGDDGSTSQLTESQCGLSVASTTFDGAFPKDEEKVRPVEMAPEQAKERQPSQGRLDMSPPPNESTTFTNDDMECSPEQIEVVKTYPYVDMYCAEDHHRRKGFKRLLSVLTCCRQGRIPNHVTQSFTADPSETISSPSGNQNSPGQSRLWFWEEEIPGYDESDNVNDVSLFTTSQSLQAGDDCASVVESVISDSAPLLMTASSSSSSSASPHNHHHHNHRRRYGLKRL